MKTLITCYAFRLLTNFVKTHHKTLLDIGIGDGNKLRYWHDRGLITAGCDNNQEYLAAAREKRFVAKNVDLNDTHIALPFSDNSFDVVSIVHVLEHVKNPKWVVEEALRITNDVVLINSPMGNSYVSDDHIHHWFTQEEVMEALVDEGTVFYFEPVISKIEDVNKYVEDRLHPELSEVYFNDLGFNLVLYKDAGQEKVIANDITKVNATSGVYNGKEEEGAD
jgi:ubiquinone/menaquinone biosynthesis C-methylase UbiE